MRVEGTGSPAFNPSHAMAIWSLTRLIPPALLAYVIWSISRRNERLYLRSVAILVLGDIGRSPRMMYHAGSFVKNEFQTYLIGYGGANDT